MNRPVWRESLRMFRCCFYISTVRSSVCSVWCRDKWWARIELGKNLHRVFNAYRPGSSIATAVTYRGADKSLARPGRKQARKHVTDARDFNKIETRAVIKFLFLQGKALNEVHAILTETLGSFLVVLRTYQRPCSAYNFWRVWKVCSRQNARENILSQSV